MSYVLKFNSLISALQLQAIYLCLFIFLSGATSISSKTLLDFNPAKKIKTKIVYNKLWNEWLKKHVTSQGHVRYTKGKKEISKVEKYLKYLLNIEFTNIKGRQNQLAYLINLYNAMVVYGVLKYHPIKSVMKIKGVSFFKLSFYFNNKKITIDDLEKKIIFPKFRQPLVHFALNCASFSCPPLRKIAYTGRKLKSQLIQQTKVYLNNKNFVKIRPSNKTIFIVELFKWYRNDLGDPKVFYKKYASDKRNISGFSVKFIPYDWSLNGS